MSNYIFKLLTSENVGDLHDLYQAAFRRAPKANAFHWKYFSNPAGDALVAGAYFNNKLVASGAMIPERSFLFGKEEIIYKCTDLMTHPEHQKKGLSKKVNELLKTNLEKKGARLCYTLCSNVSTKSFLKNEWQYMSRVLNYFQPIAILKIKQIFNRSAVDSYKVFSLPDSNFGVFSSKPNPERIQLHKEHNFLAWRSANPKFQYKIICSYDIDGRVNGHLLFSETAKGILNILDIDANIPSIKSALVNYCEQWAVSNGKRGIVVFCIEGSPLHHYIKRKFYLRNPFQRGPLQSTLDFNILQLNTKGLEASMQVDSWDLCGLNYDDI